MLQFKYLVLSLMAASAGSILSREKGKAGISLELGPSLITDIIALNFICLAEGLDAQLLQAGGASLNLPKPFRWIVDSTSPALGAVDDDCVASRATFNHGGGDHDRLGRHGVLVRIRLFRCVLDADRPDVLFGDTVEVLKGELVVRK